MNRCLLAFDNLAKEWTYAHRDLGEPALPDGTPVRRPVVPLLIAPHAEEFLAVVDSGSPISLADAQLFHWLGIDLRTATPLYEMPLGLGSNFGNVPVFEVELALRPPSDVLGPPVTWRLHLGARAQWRLPFPVLFGQRGWFEHFATIIDGHASTVRIP